MTRRCDTCEWGRVESENIVRRIGAPGYPIGNFVETRLMCRLLPKPALVTDDHWCGLYRPAETIREPLTDAIAQESAAS
jgi:hypothetical protein